MHYALAHADTIGVEDDASPIGLSISESYTVLADTIASLARRDEFLFQRLSSIISV
jgi:hypothetical protein